MITKKIPWQFVITYLVLSISICVAGYLYFVSHKKEHKVEKENELSAIADLKVSQIVSWRKERIGDAEVVFHDPLIRPYIQQWLKKKRPELKQKIKTYMESLQKYHQYKSVILLNTRGNVQLAVPDEKKVIEPEAQGLVVEAIHTKKIVFSDLYQNTTTNTICLSLVVPLLVQQSHDTFPIGAILLHIDPYTFLYPLIQSWPRLSRTSETLLVRQEGDKVVFLNELRHRRGTALTLKFPIKDTQLPAALAVRGSRGVIEGLDYRGVPVLAATRAIPDSPWFIISKVDKEEIYAPFHQHFWVVSIVIGLLIIGSGLIIYLFWRKRAEEALQERLMLIDRAKLEWESTVDSIPQLICLIDKQGNILRTNRTVEQWNLGKVVSVKGKTLHKLLHPGCTDSSCYLETFLSKAWEELTHGQFTECEVNDRVLGRYINVQVRPISPEIYRKVEKIDSYAAIVIYDITERKQQEDAVEQIRHQNELILNAVGEGIMGLDLDGKHTFVNPSAAKMLGYEVVELIDQHSHTIWHHTRADGSPYPEQECPIYAAYMDGAVHHVRNEVFWKKDGTSFPVAYTSTPIFEDGKLVGAVVTFWDITERKRSAEMLAKALNEQKNIMDTIPDIIYMLDMTGKLVKWNKRAEIITGFSSEELMGKYVLDFFPEQDKITITMAIQEAFVKGFTEVEGHLLRKDGTMVPYEWTGVPFKDEKDNVIGLIGVGRDFAERKRAEEEIRKLNEELEQRVIQRTAELEAANRELESFSYSVSHDLRAPVRALGGFSSMLLEDYADKLDDEGKHLLNTIRSSAEKMRGLIDSLLDLSRIGRKDIELSDIDMDKLAQTTFDEIKATIPERELQCNIKPLPPAYGDQGLIQQLFFNLIANAVKFTRLKETAIIEVGGYVEGSGDVYYVRDNGIGFDMQYADKLFGAFQRLHSGEQFEGTGIGLSIVQRVVNRHGGRVWAEGKLNEGATFYFSLPEKV